MAVPRDIVRAFGRERCGPGKRSVRAGNIAGGDPEAAEIVPRGGVRGLLVLDNGVGEEAFHLPGVGQLVVQALVPADVVVLEVDQAELGVGPLQSVARAVRLEQAVLGHPVQLRSE